MCYCIKGTFNIVTIPSTKSIGMPKNFYDDKVALENKMYKKVLQQTFKNQGNLPWKRGIVKIIYNHKNTKRTVIRRMFISGHLFNITQQDIGLTVMSQSILQVANTADLIIKKGSKLPFYFQHPDHVTRVGIKIAAFATVIGVVSLVTSLLSCIL